VAELVIVLIEIAQVLTPKIGLMEGFGSLGYILVVIFVLSWAVSYGIWKFSRIEERWNTYETK
jgi:nickel/cobalt transporter (NiCoT) family protein